MKYFVSTPQLTVAVRFYQSALKTFVSSPLAPLLVSLTH